MGRNCIKGWIAGLVVLAAALLPTVAQALGVPPAPSLATPIVDQTGTLSQEQINTLAQQINNSRQIKDYQMGVLIIKSLEGSPIEDYSIQVARAWGIGTAEKNNGVLLLVVKDDRQLRIEVGRGLEGDLTDSESGRIIRSTITPQFKKGDYYSGISLGIQNIAAQVEGTPEKDSSAKQASGATAGDMAEGIAILLFFGFGGISWFAAMLARSKSWWAGGVAGGVVGIIIMLAAGWVLWSIILTVALTLFGLLLDWAVSRNFANHASHGQPASWWAGGPWIGGGSSGGGGWSGGGSFGGGGFGGGGASGSW